MSWKSGLKMYDWGRYIAVLKTSSEEMCNKAVDTFHFVLDSVLDWYKTLEKCDKVVSKNLLS